MKETPKGYEMICLGCGHTCYRGKDLTDEEIRLLINDVPDYDIDTYDLFKFAKAVLAKSQERKAT
jgi:thymidine phosphorylase